MARPQATSNILESETVSTVFIWVWVIYMLSAPFYIFPKGTPQPSDALLAFGILLAVISQYRYIDTKIKPVYLIGGLFVLLTITINMVNYAFYPHVRLLLSSLYYPYNFMIFIFVTWLFASIPEKMVRITIPVLAATLLIQIGATFMDGGYRGARATAGFENPNQLAYWSLLTSVMLIFLRRMDVILKPWDYLILLMSGYLQAVALSKAGIIAFAIFLIFLIITPCMGRAAKVLASMILVIFLIFMTFQASTLFDVYNRLDVLTNVVDRIEGIGTEADDSPEVRGYFRLNNFPAYTVFGAGEGSFERFDPTGRELHSGVATMIFSYGIFGATLFFSFLILIMNRQPWYYILLFLPIILFGLPHQNFRFSDFWVLLGVNYGLFLAVQKRLQAEKTSVLLNQDSAVTPLRTPAYKWR